LLKSNALLDRVAQQFNSFHQVHNSKGINFPGSSVAVFSLHKAPLAVISIIDIPASHLMSCVFKPLQSLPTCNRAYNCVMEVYKEDYCQG
jgi:hypothetical protein